MNVGLVRAGEPEEAAGTAGIRRWAALEDPVIGPGRR